MADKMDVMRPLDSLVNKQALVLFLLFSFFFAVFQEVLVEAQTHTPTQYPRSLIKHHSEVVAYQMGCTVLADHTSPENCGDCSILTKYKAPNSQYTSISSCSSYNGPLRFETIADLDFGIEQADGSFQGVTAGSMELILDTTTNTGAKAATLADNYILKYENGSDGGPVMRSIYGSWGSSILSGSVIADNTTYDIDGCAMAPNQCVIEIEEVNVTMASVIGLMYCNAFIMLGDEKMPETSSTVRIKSFNIFSSAAHGSGRIRKTSPGTSIKTADGVRGIMECKYSCDNVGMEIGAILAPQTLAADYNNVVMRNWQLSDPLHHLQRDDNPDAKLISASLTSKQMEKLRINFRIPQTIAPWRLEDGSLVMDETIDFVMDPDTATTLEWDDGTHILSGSDTITARFGVFFTVPDFFDVTRMPPFTSSTACLRDRECDVEETDTSPDGRNYATLHSLSYNHRGTQYTVTNRFDLEYSTLFISGPNKDTDSLFTDPSVGSEQCRLEAFPEYETIFMEWNRLKFEFRGPITMR
eukprot:GHVN01051431.1.p1 GENE.GHVN01051431.1~~GHVN01051431.1.p1  ORF type:complete len:527 (-),score=64.12 GHVN01051431.1:81-1661(-)